MNSTTDNLLPLIVDLEKILGEISELFVRLSGDRSLVQSDVVRHPGHIPLIHKVEIGALVIKSHLVLTLELRNKGALVVLSVKEFGKSVSRKSAKKLVFSLGG